MTLPRRLAALCMVACMGCGGGAVDAFLGLPPPGGAQTVLVGFQERSSVRVYLGDLAAEPGLVLPLGTRRADDPPLSLAYFDARLADARLTPGWQAAAEGAGGAPLVDGAGALLGAPAAVFEADLGAEPAAWVSAQRLDPALAAFSVVPEAKGCAPFGAPRFVARVPLAIRWGVALGPTAALLASGEGDYVRVDVEGHATPVTPDAPYSAGVLRDGVLYLGTEWGEVLRATPDPLTLVQGPATLGAPRPGLVRAVAAGAADDVFALIAGGELHHFDGLGWSSWGQVDDLAGGLEWIGPQEALLTSERPELVYRAAEGRLRPEAVEGVGVLALAHVAGLGTLGGTSDGELLLRAEGAWRGLGTPRLGWWTVDVLPRPDGALYMLASGSVEGYSRADGFCPDLFAGRIVTSGFLLGLGQDVLHVARLPDQDLSELSWLPPQ
jgi:hypothetical protein